MVNKTEGPLTSKVIFFLRQKQQKALQTMWKDKERGLCIGQEGAHHPT